ncbi:MAG: hemolysin III family protein [Planctomycetota bacterium]|nr:hemolysin III family protein [Planctomycetota bacterium]
MEPRPQSFGEEVANTISHGIALLAAVAAVPVLVVAAARHGDTAAIVGASVFGGTAVLMYFASTLYHALPAGGAKRVFRILDHSAIFLLIAGTYTPFTLGVLRGSWGWTLFGIVWGLAVAGVLMKTLVRGRYEAFSLGLYLAMGWLILIAAKHVWLHLPMAGLIWLAAGGVAYTVGVPFNVKSESIRYGHFVWHLFVIIGTVCHFVAVMWYAV